MKGIPRVHYISTFLPPLLQGLEPNTCLRTCAMRTLDKLDPVADRTWACLGAKTVANDSACAPAADQCSVTLDRSYSIAKTGESLGARKIDAADIDPANISFKITFQSATASCPQALT